VTTDAAATPESFNASLRELIEATRTSRLGEVTELTALQAEIDQIPEKITAAHVPGLRMQATLDETFVSEGLPAPFGAFENAAEFFPYSPVIGPLNPISPLATFSVEDGQVRGEVKLGAAYNGPPGSVHGGIIALILDELLGSTCLAADVAGFTGTLNVRYEQTVPLDTTVQLHGWVERTEGRKTFAIGEIRHGDTLLSRAEGIFIQARKD